MKMFRQIAVSILILFFIVLGFSCTQTETNVYENEARYPKNIILFIGDGMGYQHIQAASYFATGKSDNLSFSNFPCTAEVCTASASSSITDSAASGTAMACGIKVENGVLGLRIPGDGAEVETLLEYASGIGKSTGVVTTTYLTHATPASFSAHEPSRNNYNEIAADMLADSRPDVMMGGGENGLSVAAAADAGYSTVSTAEELALHDDTLPVAGLFGTTHLPYEYDGTGSLPGLTDMVSKTLDMLSGFPDGFFLMVEGGRIDHAAHSNDLVRTVYETIEFSDAVELAVEWAGTAGDTLVVVTADHETGGLSIISDNGAGNLPEVVWSTTGHTGSNVPLYATGPGAGRFSGTIENTRIHDVLLDLLQ